MYLKNITVNNFKCFEDLTVDFSEGVNLIIGNNGTGKTSLLEALAVAIGTSFSYRPGISQKLLDNTNVRSIYMDKGESTYSLSYKFPQKISGELTWLNGRAITIEIFRRSVATEQELERGTLPSIFAKLLDDVTAKLPLFCYQRFDRDWNLKNNARVDHYVIEAGKTLRTDGYSGCLGGKDIEDKIQAWCLKMLLIGSQRNHVVHESQLFQNAIKKFMQIMIDNDADIKMQYSLENKGMELLIDGKRESIYNLSTGYRAVLYMIMELAYRSAILNPDVQDVSETEGIVLIDEIDAHLHPKWQWKVIDAICSVFPKVQFIIATHSPIVISSVRDARLIKLVDYNKAKILESAYGYTADEVIELRQGSTPRVKRILDIKEQLEDAINDDDIDKAKRILNNVKEEFGENSRIYSEFKGFLQINTWVDDIE